MTGRCSGSQRENGVGPPRLTGERCPEISELLMEHVAGLPAVRLLWLQEQKAAGYLDGDDPEEIAEAEALLAMVVRLSGSSPSRKTAFVWSPALTVDLLRAFCATSI